MTTLPHALQTAFPQYPMTAHKKAGERMEKDMKAQHTPGPWRVCGGYTAHYCAVHSERGYIVFRMADKRNDAERDGPIQCPDDEEQRANARLIAASPIMYDYIRSLALKGDLNAKKIIDAI